MSIGEDGDEWLMSSEKATIAGYVLELANTW